MVPANREMSPERAAMVQWAARLGAVTAEALAERDGCTLASAGARLRAAERARLLSSSRPLHGRPVIYTATPAGIRAIGLSGLDPCRVSAANAAHAIECAAVAVRLERAYPDHSVMGERELRAEERAYGTAIASATLGTSADGARLLHRPDLVLWPAASKPEEPLPLAIEVELTVKAPRRLHDICLAWARCRCVAGVIYVAAPEVLRPLGRAIAKAHAGERIVVLELEGMAGRI